MQRRKFLSSVLGGAASGLPLATACAAQEHAHRGVEIAARSAERPPCDAPLLTVMLADGRKASVNNIAACRTYMGLLAGRPSEDVNEWELDQLKQFCKRTLAVEESIIIPPVMIPRESEGESWTEYPPVFVAALLCSIGSARQNGVFSELAVGWFQPSLHPLFPEDILTAMQKLDWANVAYDCWR